MTNDLVPVGELKPLSWFGLGSTRCLKIDCNWYAYKTRNGTILVSEINPRWQVQPLPDCDSFDWTPPREPTALELAKALLISITGEGAILSRPWFRAELAGIIAAMEREEKK